MAGTVPHRRGIRGAGSPSVTRQWGTVFPGVLPAVFQVECAPCAVGQAVLYSDPRSDSRAVGLRGEEMWQGLSGRPTSDPKDRRKPLLHSNKSIIQGLRHSVTLPCPQSLDIVLLLTLHCPLTTLQWSLSF